MHFPSGDCVKGQVRLVGGDTGSEGRLDICQERGIWGTACKNYWTDLNSAIVCRSLGFSYLSGTQFYCWEGL